MIKTEREEIEYALEESVKLQSHYAELLNMYDGGKRIVFQRFIRVVDKTKTISRLPESERNG